MLKRVLIFTIPFFVLSWLWFGGRAETRSGLSPSQRDSYERFAKPNEPRIRAALAELLQSPDPACVITPRFPFETGGKVKCDKCEALADAGLLDKAYTPATEDGSAVVHTRYDLTAAGRALYAQNLQDARYTGLPGLCFGRSVIGELELWTPGTMTYPTIDVRYKARIENPHEILYGPHAAALGLPQLARGTDLLPVRVACATVDPNTAAMVGTLESTQVTVNGVPRCRM